MSFLLDWIFSLKEFVGQHQEHFLDIAHILLADNDEVSHLSKIDSILKTLDIGKATYGFVVFRV